MNNYRVMKLPCSGLSHASHHARVTSSVSIKSWSLIKLYYGESEASFVHRSFLCTIICPSFRYFDVDKFFRRRVLRGMYLWE